MCSATQALRFDGVNFAYGEQAVLSGFSLDIPTGVLTGLVGPNGCGKSTALKLGVGLLAPDGGTVFVDGTDLAQLSARQRARKVALLPQSLAPAAMDVESLVLCGRFAHTGAFAAPSQHDREIARACMRTAGVDDLAPRMVAALSGGQRQRAYVAMVLAQQADLMLLDEPTGALDIHAAHEILQLVRSLVYDQGKTACVVIHDLDLALRYCDHVVLMDAGQVACQGAPAEVLASGQVQRVFKVDVEEHASSHGPSWTFYPRSH